MILGGRRPCSQRCEGQSSYKRRIRSVDSIWMGAGEEGQSHGKVCLLQSLVGLRELMCVWAEVGRAEPLTSGLRKCRFLSFLKEETHTLTHTHAYQKKFQQFMVLFILRRGVDGHSEVSDCAVQPD